MQTILSRVRTYNFADRTLDQQREVITRVFHNEDFSGSINDYLLTYLPVTPTEIKGQARVFYNSVANRQICNIEEIVKKYNFQKYDKKMFQELKAKKQSVAKTKQTLSSQIHVN